MSENKEKSLAVNTGFIYIMRISSYIFPLITTPYLTRVLMEKNYGIYSWTAAIINYARLVVDFGFVIYGVEAIAKAKEDKKQIGKIIWQIVRYKGIICVLVVFFLVIFCSISEQFHEYEVIIYISYFSVTIGVFGIDYVFQGMECMQYVTTRVVITKTIFTALVFLLIKSSDQFIFVPILTAIGELVSVALMWVALKKTGISLVRCKLHEGMSLLKKSTWYFISRIFGAVFSYGNLIYIGIFLPKTQVAQYNIAFTLLSVIQNLITPLADSMYPYMVKNKNFGLVKKLILIFEPLIIICCIIGVFIAEPVVTWWFGAEYSIAAKILCCMIPIIIITLPGTLLGFPTLSALGLYKETNLAIVYAAIFHMTGFFFLYCIKSVTIFSVTILTCITEGIVLILRSAWFFKSYSK